MSKVICTNCGCEFERSIHQLRYNKKNRKAINSFCSKLCNNKFIQKTRCDEFTPFKEFYCKIKRRSKLKQLQEVVTLQDIKNQWDEQNGICAYTKVKLELAPRFNRFKPFSRNPIYTASLDRIDSKKGYIKGNIQFISIMANYAKNRFSHDMMLEFCKAINNV